MILLHILYLNHIYFQSLIGVAAALYLYSEVKVIKQQEANKNIFLYLSVIFITTGSVFSFLDLTRTLCDPTNHLFQGHALWHILSGLGLGFLIYHLGLRMDSYERDEAYVIKEVESNEEDDNEVSFSNQIISNEDDIEYFDEEEEIEEEEIEENISPTSEINSSEELQVSEEKEEDENQLDLFNEEEEEEESPLNDPIIETYTDNEISDEVDNRLNDENTEDELEKEK